jgi:hypothetical protein
MRTSKKHYFWMAAFLGILAAGWAGCTKSGSSYTTTPVTYVTVMNEAPYGPAATDVYLNNQLATGTAGIAAGAFSTKYGALQPGNYSISFKKNGSDSLLTQIAGQQTFDTLGFYTLILYNDANKTVHSTLIHDDFSTISTTSTNFRFFNLSPDAPNVDFYLGSTTTLAGRTPADNAAAENLTTSPLNSFQSTAAGTYDLKVKVNGKDSVLASLTGQNLLGGNVYTIFLTGASNNLKINVLQASY